MEVTRELLPALKSVKYLTLQAGLFLNQQPFIIIDKSINNELISLGFFLTDLSTVKFYLFEGIPMPSNIIYFVQFFQVFLKASLVKIT